jgi:predicted RND superfamily exporter protein
MTVFFVILCLFLFGGSVIHDFSFAMLIGVVTGSYSSVFVASPILIAYEELKKKKLPKPAARRATVQVSDAQPARDPKKSKKKQPAGQGNVGKRVRG